MTLRWVPLALVLVTWPSLASAQDRERARADFRAGVELLDAGHFAAAEVLFTRSLAEYGTVAAQCNLALTYDRWGGHGPAALAAFESCAEKDNTGQYRQHALDRVEALRRERDVALGRATAAPSDTEPRPSGGVVVTGGQSNIMGPSTRPENTMAGNTAETSGGFQYSEPQAPETAARTSRTFRQLGLVSIVVGAVAAIAGLALANSVASDVEGLEAAGYPRSGGYYFIPADDPGAQTLTDAQLKADVSVGLYVAAGVLGAVAITFLGIQLAIKASAGSESATVALSPVEGGGVASARFHF